MMGQRKFNMKQHHRLCLDDLVSPGHLYRKIDRVIDFTFIYDLAKPYYSKTGQPSLDPVVFFKIELVSFLEGIHEDRALERRLKDSLAIRWFLGYDLDVDLPVHSTISRTRKDRIVTELYEAVFEKILSLCISHQLVKGSHQSIDSTLLKTNACLQSLDLLQPKVREHYQKTAGSALPESKSESKKTPRSKPPWFLRPFRRDPEARVTKKPGFHAAPYYKATATVDSAHAIITHAQVDDANKNDSQLLQPIAREVKKRLNQHGLSFQSVATDKGFYSAENLKYLSDESITAYMTPRRIPTKQGDYSREHFHYEKLKDRFICPEGKPLRFRGLDDELPHLRRYRAQEKDCLGCSKKLLCTKGKARTIAFSIYEDLITEALKRSETDESKRFHRLRNIQAEGSFAQLKEILKFKKLYSLGLTNAQKKFILGCAVINLKKLLCFWRHLLEFLVQITKDFKRPLRILLTLGP